MKEKNIKIIALDLDGTALNKEKKFSDTSIIAFKEAAQRGINIVIATGRAYNSLPKQLFSIEEIRYVITSNGAVLTDLETGRPIYESCIDGQALDEIRKMIERDYVSIEACCNGRAYIDEEDLQEILHENKRKRDLEYVLNTRTPVKNIWDFIRRSKSVENICLYYSDQKEKQKWLEKLNRIDNILITSSFPNNHEIGGKNTSKANALKALMKKLGLSPCDLMAVGDSYNDLEMISLAEIGVVMGNSPEDIRREADYVTETNENEGVAKAIRKIL